MASHHFIGTGLLSERLRAAAAAAPEALLDDVAELIRGAGLGVMARQRVGFEGGGHTLVWVLSESHLVLHLWAAEGYATVDLHVCDYRESNARRARGLVAALVSFCFAPGTDSWRELELEPPLPAVGAC